MLAWIRTQKDDDDDDDDDDNNIRLNSCNVIIFIKYSVLKI